MLRPKTVAVLAGKFADPLAQIENQVVGVADDLEFLGQCLPWQNEPSGAFGRAYQTHSVLRSIWPASRNLLTPEQGQDFQHHARCLREGFDSGFAGLGSRKCRQKQTRKP